MRHFLSMSTSAGKWCFEDGGTASTGVGACEAEGGFQGCAMMPTDMAPTVTPEEVNAALMNSRFGCHWCGSDRGPDG